MMKNLSLLLALLLLLGSLSGCGTQAPQAQVAATTLPVCEFSARICEGTGITVARLVTESVSCLHDYSLNVRQVRSAEAAEVIVISGAGLEDFMADILEDKTRIDASYNVALLCGDDHAHDGHSHEGDPHIWLSPENAKLMAQNICDGLSGLYPQYADTFRTNLISLLSDLDALQAYGEAQLADLSCRELITFHDGFTYFADAFGLTILEAVEEESGSEASAQELKELITTVRAHDLPAIFVETKGAVSAAETISAATGCGVFTLDMAMSGDSYFDIMYRNIDTIREALG